MADKAHGSKGMVKIKGKDTGDAVGVPVALCVTKWEGSLKRTKHDTGSTCSGEWQTSQVGKKVVEFSLEAQLDLTQDPLGATYVLDSDYCAVELYVDAAEDPYFDIPNAVIDDITVTLMENDIITYKVSGTSSGPVNEAS
jgi:hypothetical protein